MTPMEDSATRTRTRRAIVDAAIRVWAEDPSASLGEVATAAQVGRTTLHRYFAERGQLAKAVGHDVVERVDAAAGRAASGGGSAAAGLRRLCHEYSELADVLALIFNGSQVVDDATWATAARTAGPRADQGVRSLVERGHRDGSVAVELSPAWVEAMLWSMLYASWDFLRSAQASKQDVVSMLTASFEGAIAARS
jgi:TetR/AcrR family transcriptional repressor of lfrA